MGIWADKEPRREELAVPSEASPLDFLRAVYTNPEIPLVTRMRAAAEAAQYVHPTYKATAMVIAGDSFAARLEAAIARTGLPPKLIETEPEPKPELEPTGPPATPIGAPFAQPRRRG